MKPLLIILALTFPFSLFAQGETKIFVGEKGTQRLASAHAVTEKIAIATFRDDPALHVSNDKNSYIIAQYEISVKPPNKDLMGPFLVKDNNNQQVFDKLYPYFEPGSRIFYEKIILVCRDCTPPTQIASPGIAVLLE